MSRFEKTVGIAGCGRMGLPMAQALFNAGVETYGFDIRSVSEFGDFAPRMITDPAAFAAACNIVITVVRDHHQTDDLLFDEQALTTGRHAIETLIVSSTLSPRYLQRLQERVPNNIALVDAPMSGGAIAAEEARLSFMLGGNDATLDALQPLFSVMGKDIHRMGDFTAGMTAKVLNNFAAASSVVAVRQVLAWADQLDIDRTRLLALMHDSSGQTWFGSNFEKLEFAHDGYDTDNTIGIIKKDVESAIDAVQGNPDTGLPAAIINGLFSMRPDR